MNNDQVQVIVSGKTLEVHRIRLRRWLELDEIKSAIQEATERRDTIAMADQLCTYLSVAISEDKDLFLNAAWFDVADAFISVSRLNKPRIDFPILQGKSPGEKPIWNYPGRAWYTWLHLLAQRYGWSIEYISDMEIEVGIALMQEILIDDQLEQESRWSMTEIAYPYNATTKRSSFHPLKRPDWMEGREVKIKTIKYRQSLIPMGNVINMTGMNFDGTPIKPIIH